VTQPRFIPLPPRDEVAPAERSRRAHAFYEEIRRRRTVRDYSDRAVPRDVIEQCLLAAGTAPNGANRQPWHFVVVTEPELKRRIREAAEREERDFYEHRAPPEWLEALAPLGTGPDKPFLETAPVLIAIFAQSYEVLPDGRRSKNYYVTESVGIATGILITALHHAGLCTLTHTPSPMGFLGELLERPSNERPFLLLVVGFPASNATVPDITKKPLAEIATFKGDVEIGGIGGIQQG
jgi:iodotyrosine deiodinase